MRATVLTRYMAAVILGAGLAAGCATEKASPASRYTVAQLGDEVPGYFEGVSEPNSGGVQPAGPGRWKMSFKEAAQPYSHEVYKYEGYVNAEGDVVNGGLGCSGFVSVVLHRMRYGDGWQGHYDRKLYQDYGDVIARKSGLPLVCTIESGTLVAPEKCRAFFESRGVNVGAILVFNVREGVHGHVGFVRVMPGGRLAQFHYSGMARYNGLAQGDFVEWYSRSMYKASPVELYGVTNDPLHGADARGK